MSLIDGTGEGVRVELVGEAELVERFDGSSL